jgi:hypothetical protein
MKRVVAETSWLPGDVVIVNAPSATAATSSRLLRT